MFVHVRENFKKGDTGVTTALLKEIWVLQKVLQE